jgi:hypothetical protein
MKTHINVIIEFLAAQMDGEQVPPTGSAALDRLSEAVAAINKTPSDPVLQELALRTLGAVIDRVRSGIGAEQTLRAFLTGGDRHV